MAAVPPTAEQLLGVNVRLQDLIDAITEHPQWQASSPQANPTLYYVWDFVMRSKYMLSEYDNIKAGRPLQHPTQFRGGAGTGDQAALKVFQDVCGRTMMVDMMVNDTSGRTAMMTGSRGPPLDFGQKVKDAVKALREACPEEHFMAGLMN